MTRLVSKFLTALANGYADAAVTDNNGLLLAVSGGIDSVALLHGTLQLWPDSHRKIAVAHVNHRLRGSESDADAEFVETLATSLDIPCESLTAETGSVQANSAGSLEEAARNVRYDFLTDTAKRLGLAHVVTAHHLDDQAETVLHNILRGTGLRGLAGMRSSRPLNKTVNLVRPMLAISRTQIDAVIAATGWEYRDDHTNHEVVHTRNRIRHQLLPLLSDIYNPQIKRTLVNLAQQAADAARCMDELADQVLDAIVLESGPEICRLDADRAAATPVELLRHALTRLWVRLQWPRQKMTFDHWQRLSTVIRTSTETSFQLPGPIDVRRTGRMVRLAPVAADFPCRNPERQADPE
ncbi:MAG: tRNA lysidine(34) synthetase TilS [Planctomycetaceae bacterium]